MNNKTPLPVKIAVILLFAVNVILLFNYRVLKTVWEAKAAEKTPYQIHTEAEKDAAEQAAEAEAAESAADPAPADEKEDATVVQDNQAEARNATVAAGTAINVRSGPGTAFDVVAVLDNGALVAIVEENGEWSHIQSEDGIDGYVLTRFLQ